MFGDKSRSCRTRARPGSGASCTCNKRIGYQWRSCAEGCARGERQYPMRRPAAIAALSLICILPLAAQQPPSGAADPQTYRDRYRTWRTADALLESDAGLEKNAPQLGDRASKSGEAAAQYTKA